MITIYNKYMYKGLSTDNKPKTAPENATFIELDTGIGYYFSKKAWHVFGENKPEDLGISASIVG